MEKILLKSNFRRILYIFVFLLFLSGCQSTKEEDVSTSAISQQTVPSEEQSSQQERFLQYDVVYLNRYQDYRWYPGDMFELFKLRSYVSIRYEETENPQQLYAYQAKVYYYSGKGREILKLYTDSGQVWKEFCLRNSFIPYFPDESNGIPNTDRFYFFATLDQVRAIGEDPIDGFGLEIVDVMAPPADRTGGEEAYIHLKVELPMEK